MGATIHMHYCMNDFVGSSLWHGKKDNKCGKCGMTEKKGGCCKDEHKQLKLKTDHQKTAIQFVPLLATPVLLTPGTDFDIYISFTIVQYPTINGPPKKVLKERLYLLNGVFLI